MISPRSTLPNPSSSRLGQAYDQHSTRLALLSCLERLDRLDHRVHEEIQEIRSFFTDLLDNCQSDVTMGDLGGCDSTVNSQAGLNELNAIPPFVSSHDRFCVPRPAPHRTSFGITGSLSEGTGPPQGGLFHYGTPSSADYGPTARPSLTQPQHSTYSEAFSVFCDPRVTESGGADPDLGQLFQDLSLHGTSSSAYRPTAQPFRGIYFGEHVPSSYSASPDEQPAVPVVQASHVKDKVKCTWYGCPALVNKDNLTRHVKEVHEGKIKAVCAGCGREFKRPYQMNEHILRSHCGRS
ncbi:hypothetical protein EDB19DRAFT_1904541 [Suillus lakei]|nr:hypothetical protein EDB19DRAFT_1904541 [Suillus lakei]